MDERVLFSKAGRLTMIKYVMNGNQCIMSLFRMPSSICKSMEKYMRDFLWEGVDEGHGFHLLSWELGVGGASYEQRGVRD